jgi:SSU ribosomal protein S6P
LLFKAPPTDLNKLEEFFRVTPQILRWQTFRREDLEKKSQKEEIPAEENKE